MELLLAFFVTLTPSIFQNEQGNWCGCQNTFSCRETAGFYSLNYNLKNMAIFGRNDSDIELVVPGSVSGCVPLESLLASSLECLYNTTCISHLSSPQSPIEQLKYTNKTQYTINSTVEELLEHLMIEQWTPNISFTAYFAKCNPTWCNYTIPTRPSSLYVVTTLLGLYGGLSVFLRLMTPHIINLLFAHLCKRNNNAEHSPLTRK